MTYAMKLTIAGAAKIAAAQAGGTAVTLIDFAVGDGGGNAVAAPIGTEVDLVNEVWRGDIDSLAVKPGSPTIVIAEANIPSVVGGWAIREIAIFDDDGDLFAYGNFPTTYKALAAEGSSREMIFRAELAVGAAANIQLVIDPSLVLASRAWCLSVFLQKALNLSDVADPDEARENIGAAKVSDADPAGLAAAPDPGDSPDAARADHQHQVPAIADIPGLTAALNGLVVTPVGGILPLAGAQDPRWLKCNGSAYLQSAYPALYAKLGLLPRLVWTKRTAPPNPFASVQGLRYLNGNWVTLGTGASNSAYFSANNGTSWTAVTGNLSSIWRDMCWTGAKYVLVGDSNSITNSATLGAAFTARTSAFAAGSLIYGVASNGAGLVVAVANSGSLAKAAYSTDHGDTWTVLTLPGAGNWQVSGGVLFADGRFVVVANDWTTETSTIYTSINGIAWTAVAGPLAGNYTEVYYVNGAFYALGPSAAGYGVVAKSTNGTSWTVLSAPAYPLGNSTGLTSILRKNAASIPGGLLTFNSANNTPAPAQLLYDDLRQVMQLRPPGMTLATPLGASVAYGGGLIMMIHPDAPSACWTAPVCDYNVATEFVVPDLGPMPGANTAPFYIRAN